MKSHRWALACSILLFLFVGSSCVYAISDQEIAKIESAVPKKPAVKPRRPRRMLVFNLCNGFRHSCIPYWARALEIMGKTTAAFEVELSTDMSAFDAENLKRFDAVCLNNTTQLRFNPEQQKALMDFVKGGKGIVGIHAATDNFNDWPEAAEMMGGRFSGHPWGAGGTWAVKIDDPGHRLTKAFAGRGFKINDEIYRTEPPLYSRTKQRVLLSLDMTDQATKKRADKATDVDTGISWVKSFGKGRVFYCSLGHNHHILWNPAVLQHCLDGIQFALGDLVVDTTPGASLKKREAVKARALPDKLQGLQQSRSEIEAVLAKVPKDAVKGKLRKLNIILLADKKDHGTDEHDYPLWQKRWKVLLGGGRNVEPSERHVNLYGPERGGAGEETVKGAAKVKVSTAWGWPSSKQFNSADLIVMYCHGRGRWNEQKLNDIEKYLSRGGGLVVVHSAVITTPNLSQRLAGLIGAAWEEGYTGWRHGPIALNITAGNHPICLGLPETILLLDEIYWPLRGDLSKATVLATSDETLKGSDQTKPQLMFWTYQYGKGRVFGCIGGHYTWTFDDPYFRILLLRGMAWAAGESPYRLDGLVLRGALLK